MDIMDRAKFNDLHRYSRRDNIRIRATNSANEHTPRERVVSQPIMEPSDIYNYGERKPNRVELDKHKQPNQFTSLHLLSRHSI